MRIMLYISMTEAVIVPTDNYYADFLRSNPTVMI